MAEEFEKWFENETNLAGRHKSLAELAWQAATNSKSNPSQPRIRGWKKYLAL